MEAVDDFVDYSHGRQRYEDLVRDYFDPTSVKQMIEESPMLRLPTLPSGRVGVIASFLVTVWYLSRRYADQFDDPINYNIFFSISVQLRHPSAENIFRQTFDHFPLTPDQDAKLAEYDSPYARFPVHWPLPDLGLNFLTPWLPRPDKYTFIRALEYAHFTQKPYFAREVWYRRESWRAHLLACAVKDISLARWEKVSPADLLKYEQMLCFPDMPLHTWVAIISRVESSSGTSAGYLYEAYARMLYARVMAKAGFCDEAYEVLAQGTGENFPWNKTMLGPIQRMAAVHGHETLHNFIHRLDE
jgi:hypothetical protein